MDYAPLRVDVLNERIIAAGELDLSTSPVLIQAVLGLAGPARRALDLDLSQVTFIDCAGLRALLQLRTELPGLRVVAWSKQIERLVDLSGWRESILDVALQRAG